MVPLVASNSTTVPVWPIASYALKLLQSDGEVTIASTGKDATTGKLVTQQYRVEGPVMLFLTTTAIDDAGEAHALLTALDAEAVEEDG